MNIKHTHTHTHTNLKGNGSKEKRMKQRKERTGGERQKNREREIMNKHGGNVRVVLGRSAGSSPNENLAGLQWKAPVLCYFFGEEGILLFGVNFCSSTSFLSSGSLVSHAANR